MARLAVRFRRFLEVISLSLAGALPISAFFISAMFTGYVPLSTTETGTVLILMPLFVGILFGFLLGEYDLRVAAVGSLVITLFASVFIVIFITSPLIAGVASAAPAVTPGEVLEIYVAQRIMLFVVMSFPVLLLGAILGRALSERILPSEELRQELERLRAETREWHQILERTGRIQTPLEAEEIEKSKQHSNDSLKSR